MSNIFYVESETAQDKIFEARRSKADIEKEARWREKRGKKLETKMSDADPLLVRAAKKLLNLKGGVWIKGGVTGAHRWTADDVIDAIMAVASDADFMKGINRADSLANKILKMQKENQDTIVRILRASRAGKKPKKFIHQFKPSEVNALLKSITRGIEIIDRLFGDDEMTKVVRQKGGQMAYDMIEDVMANLLREITLAKGQLGEAQKDLSPRTNKGKKITSLLSELNEIESTIKIYAGKNLLWPEPDEEIQNAKDLHKYFTFVRGYFQNAKKVIDQYKKKLEEELRSMKREVGELNKIINASIKANELKIKIRKQGLKGKELKALMVKMSEKILEKHPAIDKAMKQEGIDAESEIFAMIANKVKTMTGKFGI